MVARRIAQAVIRLSRAPGVRHALRFVMAWLIAPIFRLRARWLPRRSVLFAGQAYYNAWYLSRGLRGLGWEADVLDWDPNDESRNYYHGHDFRFTYRDDREIVSQLAFYLTALWRYDVFHFSNAHAIKFGELLAAFFKQLLGSQSEIWLLRRLGKKIVYSNNGCLDGVSQASFRKWGPEPVCEICPWRERPEICSDERNLSWGRFRNAVADYQCLLGGNRVDYNVDPRVHEVPEFYCLDPDFWRPDLEIPERYRLSFPDGTVRFFHAVGNFDTRTDKLGVNLKSTHIYVPLVERLKREGHKVELMFFSKVPNRELRFYQAQADIFLDMLTYGFFGATAREAMMLGKPVVCFLRPEWLESMRREIPDYVDELPVVSATPSNVHDILVELLVNEQKRLEIGRRSREFALKWHSADAGARRFDQIYSALLGL